MDGNGRMCWLYSWQLISWRYLGIRFGNRVRWRVMRKYTEYLYVLDYVRYVWFILYIYVLGCLLWYTVVVREYKSRCRTHTLYSSPHFPTVPYNSKKTHTKTVHINPIYRYLYIHIKNIIIVVSIRVRIYLKKITQIDNHTAYHNKHN